MTYEEMMEAADALLEEALLNHQNMDHLIIGDDAVVDEAVLDELHAQFEAASNSFEKARDIDHKGFDEIIAAATKLRDAGLAFTRYVELIAAATGTCH